MLAPKRLYLTVGTKFEHNDYTGFEAMPSVRAAWTPSDHNMFWAAVSRALRAPSRNDTNLIVNIGGVPGPNGVPILVRFFGDPRFEDERLIAYEAGYRTSLSVRLSIDLAAYFNDYDNLRTTEPSISFFEPTPLPAHQVQSVMYQNLMRGEVHGLEIAATWKMTDRWSHHPGYAIAKPHMMDGLEATAAIRDKEKHSGSHLPVVAMTAHAMVGDRERCLAAGMDDYITKPIRPDELSNLLARYLPTSSAEKVR
jgi:iron complex outermembrane recepter protein